MSSPDPAPTATPNPAERLSVAFGRLLRMAGLRVPLDTVLAFAGALDLLGLDDRDGVYWAARATLVRRPEDLPLFERAFKVFWERRRGGPIEPDAEELKITLAIDIDDQDDDDDANDESTDADDNPTIHLRFSAVEVLRHKDFSDYTDDELTEAHQLMSRLRLVGSPRRSRRLIAAKRDRGRPDLRRTVRSALRAGGEPVRRKFLTPDERPRRLVLLLDVSGSMEPYARALLRFVHAAVVGRQKVEAFALGTRLTRMTRQLSNRDPDLALRKASDSVTDWAGGTRLGEGLKLFNDLWGVRGMARGAIVVILSDGWDRGDPDELGEQMLRLHRITHQLVWVNPLKVTPGYAPLARGMAAALPHVDAFVEGHSIDAIDELARVISGIARPADRPSPNGGPSSQSLTTDGRLSS